MHSVGQQCSTELWAAWEGVSVGLDCTCMSISEPGKRPSAALLLLCSWRGVFITGSYWEPLSGAWMYRRTLVPNAHSAISSLTERSCAGIKYSDWDTGNTMVPCAATLCALLTQLLCLRSCRPIPQLQGWCGESWLWQSSVLWAGAAAWISVCLAVLWIELLLLVSFTTTGYKTWWCWSGAKCFAVCDPHEGGCCRSAEGLTFISSCLFSWEHADLHSLGVWAHCRIRVTVEVKLVNREVKRWRISHPKHLSKLVYINLWSKSATLRVSQREIACEEQNTLHSMASDVRRQGSGAGITSPGHLMKLCSVTVPFLADFSGPSSQESDGASHALMLCPTNSCLVQVWGLTSHGAFLRSGVLPLPAGRCGTARMGKMLTS